jgi:hypothetical protein
MEPACLAILHVHRDLAEPIVHYDDARRLAMLSNRTDAGN